MIRRAAAGDERTLAALSRKLYDGHTTEALALEWEELLRSPSAAGFLAYEDGAAVGFAQCQLRRDYVEGTRSSPVGYLEGVFVEEHCRRKGIAARLLSACEAWAKQMGCTEFASDCALSNEESISFHAGAGFREAGRIVCFVKRL